MGCADSKPKQRIVTRQAPAHKPYRGYRNDDVNLSRPPDGYTNRYDEFGKLLEIGKSSEYMCKLCIPMYICLRMLTAHVGCIYVCFICM